MGHMSELQAHHDQAPSALRVLLYSDNVRVREQVRLAVGKRIGERPVTWVECATHEAAVMHADAGGLDLMVLDAEAAKSGGMGLARQFKHELFSFPPILLLVGRIGDAWLATWSEAEAAVAHPLDPFQVKEAIESLLVPSKA